MKKQELNFFNELLESNFPSSLTKRIELDGKFFELQQFANKNLIELTFPNQKFTRLEG